MKLKRDFPAVVFIIWCCYNYVVSSSHPYIFYYKHKHIATSENIGRKKNCISVVYYY